MGPTRQVWAGPSTNGGLIAVVYGKTKDPATGKVVRDRQDPGEFVVEGGTYGEYNIDVPAGKMLNGFIQNANGLVSPIFIDRPSSFQLGLNVDMSLGGGESNPFSIMSPDGKNW